MTWKRKTFVADQSVEVQRDASWDHSKGWEPARYLELVPDMKWHRVKLPDDAKPRYIDRDTGIELQEPTPNTFESRVLLVPARRIREPPPPRVPHPEDSDECDECDGRGEYYINGEPRACICSEPQT